MPEEYEIISIDPIRKLEEEVEELKQSIHSLREEIAIKTDNNIHTNNKPVHSPSANALIEYAKINQDIVNSLIKSNIELQSKIAELVVSTHELNKNVQRLVDIFKEAAIEYLEKMKKGEIKKEEKENPEVKMFAQKLEDIEKINLKIAEVLEKLNKSIESLKKKESEKQQQIPPFKPPVQQPPKFPPLPPAPPSPRI